MPCALCTVIAYIGLKWDVNFRPTSISLFVSVCSRRILSLLKDFNDKERLRPIKIMLLEGDGEGKQAQLKPIIKAFE